MASSGEDPRNDESVAHGLGHVHDYETGRELTGFYARRRTSAKGRAEQRPALAVASDDEERLRVAIRLVRLPKRHGTFVVLGRLVGLHVEPPPRATSVLAAGLAAALLVSFELEDGVAGHRVECPCSLPAVEIAVCGTRTRNGDLQ